MYPTRHTRKETHPPACDNQKEGSVRSQRTPCIAQVLQAGETEIAPRLRGNRPERERAAAGLPNADDDTPLKLAPRNLESTCLLPGVLARKEKKTNSVVYYVTDTKPASIRLDKQANKQTSRGKGEAREIPGRFFGSFSPTIRVTPCESGAEEEVGVALAAVVTPPPWKTLSPSPGFRLLMLRGKKK